MADTHFSALEAKHAGLETRIADEQRRPSPDTGMLAALKRQKLRLKEQLQGL